jgi:hypothetical protein
MWQPRAIRTARTKRSRRTFALGQGLDGLEARTLLSSASFALTSDWGSGFGGQVTISNTQATPVSNWSLAFDWDRAITSIWDASITSHVGNRYVISNSGYNATIAAKSSVSFGFNGAAGNVGNDVPANYVLNGAPLGSAAPPAISIGNVSVNDGPAGATAAFTVNLSQASSSPIAVSYATVDGSAKAGTDYSAVAGTLTFNPGTLSHTISVPITPDTTAKPNETFQVVLTNAVGATLANTSATGTIVDTVAPPSSSAPASVSFAITNDWGSGFGGQITITNNGATAINNWSLAFDWDRAITEMWNASVSSRSGNHYVVGNAGWNATIPGHGSVTFGFNGSSGNVGTDIPANYLLNNVPLGKATPSLTINSVTVSDGPAGATAAFTVVLSPAATAPVNVKYATADISAHAGTDYTAVSGTLTFQPGVVSQTILVPIKPDTVAKPSLSFQVNLTSASGATIAAGSAVGSIVDTVPASPTPPSANNIATQTVEGTPITINVLASASDPNCQTLSVASFTQPSHGTVTQNSDGTLTYSPASGYLGADSFTYTVADTVKLTATGTVSLTVLAPSAASVWPRHVFAPYVDMANYPTYNLSSAVQAAGIKYFTLAFIVADANDAPAWGGYTEYEVNGGTFDRGIRAQVAQVRAAGGDVSVSFGGENGQELAQVITSVPALTAAYQQVIDAYGLTHIDFDIEGAAVNDQASIDRRSQAIAAVQRAAAANGKTLSVSFTLPVLPTGLTSSGLYVLQSALKYGVQIGTVNVMAMDYGDGAAPNPSGKMGTYAIDAAQSTYNQLGTLYGTTKTSSQLWAMVGVTPLIGVNDMADEVFVQADAQELLAFARQKGLGELSFWSLLRDQEDPHGALGYSEYNSSSIVQTPFEFSDIFNVFTGNG